MGNSLRVCWPRQIEILDSRWPTTGSHLGPVWGYLWETQPRVVHRKMGESHLQHSERLLGWDCSCLEESLPFLLLPQLWWCGVHFASLKGVLWGVLAFLPLDSTAFLNPSGGEKRKKKSVANKSCLGGVSVRRAACNLQAPYPSPPLPHCPPLVHSSWPGW